jgi:hypothetical protein
MTYLRKKKHFCVIEASSAEIINIAVKWEGGR